MKNCNDDYQQFTGTEGYHGFNFGLNLTDGVIEIAEQTGSFWFLDVIASYIFDQKVNAESFQVWTLKRIEDNKFLVSCADGNDNVIITQEISFSDFEYDKYVIWKMDNVLLLPSEN
jgi:hypothetical protein